MLQIQQVQAGVPLQKREPLVRLIDVYNDKVADKLAAEPQALTLDECLHHQVACFYFSGFVGERDKALGPSLMVFKELAKLRRLTIQDLIVQKAMKIADAQIAQSEYYSAETRSALREQLKVRGPP